MAGNLSRAVVVSALLCARSNEGEVNVVFRVCIDLNLSFKGAV